MSLSKLFGKITFRLQLDPAETRKRKRSETVDSPTEQPAKTFSVVGYIFHSPQNKEYLLSLPRDLLHVACQSARDDSSVIVSNYTLLPLEGPLEGLLEVQSLQLQQCKKESFLDSAIYMRNLSQLQFREALDERLNRKTRHSTQYSFYAHVWTVSPIITLDPKEPFALVELVQEHTTLTCLLVLCKESLLHHAAILPGRQLQLVRVPRQHCKIASMLLKLEKRKHISGRVSNYAFVVTCAQQIQWNHTTSTSSLCTTTTRAWMQAQLEATRLNGTVRAVQTVHVGATTQIHCLELVVPHASTRVCTLFVTYLPLPSALQQSLQPGVGIEAFHVHRIGPNEYCACLRSTLVLVQMATSSSKQQQQTLDCEHTNQLKSPCAYLHVQTSYTEWACRRHLAAALASFQSCLLGPDCKITVQDLLRCVSPRATTETKRIQPRNPYAEFFDHDNDDETEDDASDSVAPSGGCHVSAYDPFLPCLVPLRSIHAAATQLLLETSLPFVVDTYSVNVGWTGSKVLTADQLYREINKTDSTTRTGSLHTGGNFYCVSSSQQPKLIGALSDESVALPVSARPSSESCNGRFVVAQVDFTLVSFVCIGTYAVEKVTASAVGSDASVEQDACVSEEDRKVYVNNISFASKRPDVLNVFHGLDVTDCTLPTFPDSGRLQGYGQIVFGSVADYERALKLDGTRLGNRCLLIKPANSAKAPPKEPEYTAPDVRDEHLVVLPTYSTHNPHSAETGACVIIRHKGFVFAASIRLEADNLTVATCAELERISDNQKLCQANGSIQGCLDPRVETTACHFIQGLLVRKSFKLAKVAKGRYTGASIVLSHAPKGVETVLAEYISCVQSVDMRLPAEVDPDKVSDLRGKVANVLGISLASECFTLASIWWKVADNARCCAILGGGCEETVDEGALLPIRVLVKVPSKNMHVDPQRGYVRFRCSLEECSAYSISCYADGFYDKKSPVDFVGRPKFIDGMLDRRPHRKKFGVEGTEQMAFGELARKPFDAGVPSTTLAELHWDICEAMKDERPEIVGPSLVREVLNARLLGVAFCQALGQCTQCWSTLKFQKRVTDSDESLAGFASHFAPSVENANPQTSYWDRPLSANFNAHKAPPAVGIFRAPVVEERPELDNNPQLPFTTLCCPNNCAPVHARIKWECSGTIDDGTGQARLFSESETALQLLGMSHMTIQVIEKGAWLNENGVLYSRGMPPKAYLRGAIQTARVMAKQDVGHQRQLEESDVIKYLTAGARAEYLMQKHCRESMAPFRDLVYFVRCKPTLGDDIVHLNQTSIETTAPGARDCDADKRDAATYTLPPLKLILVDCRHPHAS
jgi:hypothetical protein